MWRFIYVKVNNIIRMGVHSPVLKYVSELVVSTVDSDCQGVPTCSNRCHRVLRNYLKHIFAQAQFSKSIRINVSNIGNAAAAAVGEHFTNLSWLYLNEEAHVVITQPERDQQQCTELHFLLTGRDGGEVHIYSCIMFCTPSSVNPCVKT
jgi:hypothetical protein